MGILVLLSSASVLLVVGAATVLVYRMLHPHRKTYAHALAQGLLTGPEELGLRHEERRFRLRDGSTTLGWIIDGENKQGPVVVMTHGWESSVYSLLGRAPLFVKHASRLVLYDMRGHGESTSRICRLGTVEADDIHEIIEQVQEADTPVVLFGSSMGAGVSIVSAAKDTQKCDTAGRRQIVGVIAEAPYRYGMEPIYGHFRQQGWPGFPVVSIAYPLLMIRLRKLWRFDRVRYASELRCPLLILHGTADPISRFESGTDIAAAADDGQLIAFEGGSHGDLLEVDAHRYATALSEFFTKLGSAFGPVGETDNTALSPGGTGDGVKP